MYLLIQLIKENIHEAAIKNTKHKFLQLLTTLNNLPLFLNLMQPFDDLFYSCKYWCARFFNVLFVRNRHTMKKVVTIISKYNGSGSIYDNKKVASKRSLLLQQLVKKGKQDVILFDELQKIAPISIIDLILQYDTFYDFHMLKYVLKNH